LDGVCIGVGELEHLADVSYGIAQWRRYARASRAIHRILRQKSRSLVFPGRETIGFYFGSHRSLAGLARGPGWGSPPAIDQVRREFFSARSVGRRTRERSRLMPAHPAIPTFMCWT